MRIFQFILLALAALSAAASSAAPPDGFDEESWMKSHLAAWQGRLRPERTARLDDRIDLAWVDLALAPDLVTGFLAGEATLCLRSREAGLQEVAFDLHDNLAVSQVEGATSYSHAGDLLLCHLPQPLDSGAQVCLTIHYAGNPASVGFGSYSLGSHGGVPILSTLSEPNGAPSWWPTKDDPADKADSAQVRITVPLGFTATSNGTLEVVDTLGTQLTWRWRERHPIATYLLCMTVTNFVAIHDQYMGLDGSPMPVVHYVWPEHLANATEDFNVTVPMIGFFASRFGEYPFLDEKYGHSIFTWGGAMEHQCNTSYGQVLIRGDHAYDYIVAHELAHQWYGDQVTCAAWEDIWLNEGFATYAEALWKEHLGGHAALVQHMTTRCFVTDPSGPIYDPPSTFNANTVYRKGAWLLHMLRGQVGDSAFLPLLHDWAQGPFSYGSAHVADFTAHAAAYTGRDLTGLWNGYLYGLNRPNYRWDWRARTVGGLPVCELRVRQNQVEPPFDLWLPWRITAGGSLDRQVRNHLRLQGHVVVTGQAPSAVQLDPDDWILETKGLANWNGALRHLALLARHADGAVPAPGLVRARCGTSPGAGDWRPGQEQGVVALELRELAPAWNDGDSLWIELEGLDPGRPAERLAFALAPGSADWQDLGLCQLQTLAAPVTTATWTAAGLRLEWAAVPGAWAYRVEAADEPWPQLWQSLGETTGTVWQEAPVQERRCYRVVALTLP
jgi:hypothetical protein